MRGSLHLCKSQRNQSYTFEHLSEQSRESHATSPAVRMRHLHAGDRGTGPSYRSPARASARAEGGYGRASSYREGATPRRRSLTPTGSGKDAHIPPPPQASLLEHEASAVTERAVSLHAPGHQPADEEQTVRLLRLALAMLDCLQACLLAGLLACLLVCSLVGSLACLTVVLLARDSERLVRCAC